MDINGTEKRPMGKYAWELKAFLYKSKFALNYTSKAEHSVGAIFSR